MPYSSLKEANIKKLDGVNLSLDQANLIARTADAIKREGKADNPWAIAISSFKKNHTIKKGKWTKKMNMLQEALAGKKEK